MRRFACPVFLSVELLFHLAAGADFAGDGFGLHPEFLGLRAESGFLQFVGGLAQGVHAALDVGFAGRLGAWDFGMRLAGFAARLFTFAVGLFGFFFFLGVQSGEAGRQGEGEDGFFHGASFYRLRL